MKHPKSQSVTVNKTNANITRPCLLGWHHESFTLVVCFTNLFSFSCIIHRHSARGHR